MLDKTSKGLLLIGLSFVMLIAAFFMMMRSEPETVIQLDDPRVAACLADSALMADSNKTLRARVERLEETVRKQQELYHRHVEADNAR